MSFKKVKGIFVEIKNDKKLEKFKKGHSYISIKTGSIMIHWFESENDKNVLNQWEHWDECSLCKAMKNEKK